MLSPAPPHRSSDNKILAAPGNLVSQNSLERVSLAQGETVYEADAPIEHVYFPETAVLSMLAVMEDGATVEVGPVGDEGMAGLSVFFGGTISPTRVIVHVAGSVMRLKADVFRDELRAEASAMPRLLLRYTQMLLAMTCQSGACYKLHHLEQQLARWLLMMHDYVGKNDLLLTQDLMSLTLGVRRAGVTEAAVDFKRKGLIDYSRGHIQILDRQGLEARACECYQVIKGEYDLLYTALSRHST